MSEATLREELTEQSRKNYSPDEYSWFLGAGAYQHFIPAVVKHLAMRAEFYTAYTPYQPELSQGMLQAIFEYQTMICQLTGLDVSNASLYDGASALAEAANIAVNQTKRNKIFTAASANPFYRQVLKTYGGSRGWQIEEIGFADGLIKPSADWPAKIDSQTAAVIVQQPNFFGCVEKEAELSGLAEACKKQGAHLIMSVNPTALALLKTPGELGASVACGEGQGLGLPLAFGGPYLGFIAVKQGLVRLIPGRLVGETVDSQGRRGFVLTLQTREQHIRRETATSNICSNQALCALQATIYLSALGPAGLKEVALQSVSKTQYAREKLAQLKNYQIKFSAPVFNEIVLACPQDPARINQKLLDKKIIGGLPLGEYYPELKDCLLLAFTETTKKEAIDQLIKALGEI